MKFVLRILAKLLFRVNVKGLGYAPANPGKLVIISNHESFLDGLLLGLFLPFDATFIVHTGVAKNPFFKLILSLTDYLAVDPTSPLAIKKAVRLVESGKPVVIFPEGRITLTGSLMKVYEGPAFIAARAGANILPVRIDGPSRSYFGRLEGQHQHKIFPKISITFSPVIPFPIPEAPKLKERRYLAGENMRRLMQEMVFEAKPNQTLFEAFLEGYSLRGRRGLILEDIKQQEEAYSKVLIKNLALGRLTSKVTKERETVGVLMPNVSNTVSLIFGLSLYNRVPGMLNYTAGADSILGACQASGINTIITSEQFIKTAKLESIVEGLKGIKIVYLEKLKENFSLLDKFWLFSFARWLPSCVQKNKDPLAPAVVLFTSGSEGKPKGVVHSHQSILSNISQICAVIDVQATDKFMMVLPLFHAFGFTCGAIMPLVTGTKMFLYPSPLHYRVIPEVIYDRGCTVLFGTSTFLGNYAKFAHPYDFYKLRYVVAGAEKLNPEVRNIWFEKFGVRILEGYGATECAPVLAVNTPMTYRSGSVGPLLPGMSYKLEPVPGIDEGGRLFVRGPNVMMGYYLYNNPGVIQAPIDGWYDTGDIVFVDKDGFLHIKGRAKRFAKIAGEMVSLEVVEKIAHEADKESLSAAVSISDQARGESLILFTTNEKLSREMLVTAAKQLGAPELAVPKKIVWLKEIPLLGTGKTDYVKLAEVANGDL